jgi:orotate phosphoribosyltransferase
MQKETREQRVQRLLQNNDKERVNPVIGLAVGSLILTTLTAVAMALISVMAA